jgi:hypothetical protein
VYVHVNTKGETMKTERITLLGSTEFKAFLSAEAEKAGMSVSELVRQRCEQKPGEDELLLASLSKELHRAVKEAKDSLAEGMAAVKEALDEAGKQRPTK